MEGRPGQPLGLADGPSRIPVSQGHVVYNYHLVTANIPMEFEFSGEWGMVWERCNRQKGMRKSSANECETQF